MAKQTNPIADLVQSFTIQLIATIEAQSTQRLQGALMAALGTDLPKRRGRPPKNALRMPGANGVTLPSLFVKARAKRAKQMCPVPGCKNVAAPIFGMVCGTHKDVPKGQIKKYREARKAAKKA